MKTPREYLKEADCLICNDRMIGANIEVIEKVIHQYAEDFFNEQVQFHYFEVKKGNEDETESRN